MFRREPKSPAAPPPPPAVGDKSKLAHTPPPPPPMLTPTSAAKLKLWPEKGSYVYAKILDWQDYYGGLVVKVNAGGDGFEILFDDGERHSNVKRSEMVKTLDQISAIKDTTLPAVLSHRFRVGDKVSCKISGWSNYYDGVVTSLHAQGYSVDFADGEKVSVVREKEMIPNMTESEMQRVLQLPEYVKLKSRIEVKFTGWNKYYAGVVREIATNRATCTVQFEDGETKVGITSDMVRISKTKSVQQIKFIAEEEEEDEGSSSSHKFALQDRVMANPHGIWSKSFPGRIEHLLTNGTYGILFDDGDRMAGVEEKEITLENATLKLNQGPSMEDTNNHHKFVLGQSVEAKVGLWRKYYPGTITRVNANNGTFQVEFVDGEVIDQVKLEEMRLHRLRMDSITTSAPVSPTAAAAAVGGKEDTYTQGERVAAKIKGWQNFWGGYVVQVNDQEKTYKVEFDDGEMYYVFPEDMMRPLPGSSLYKPVLKPVNPSVVPVQPHPLPVKIEFAFEVGERVECKLQDWQSYYPGLVEKCHETDGTGRR
ncbi:hypothetical protein BASA81_000953 [Batrachochytrium salamandrivorans]|nr:hypothetical protein BASA81_000953 [Batrachochytrium salamandrivorans]